jgi:hypothetical protein
MSEPYDSAQGTRVRSTFAMLGPFVFDQRLPSVLAVELIP